MKPSVRNPPRNGGYFSHSARAFSIEKCNFSRSGYLSKFDQLLHLPRIVTLQHRQILHLPQKVTLVFHQIFFTLLFSYNSLLYYSLTILCSTILLLYYSLTLLFFTLLFSYSTILLLLYSLTRLFPYSIILLLDYSLFYYSLTLPYSLYSTILLL